MKIRPVRGVVTPLSLLLTAVFAGAQDPSQSALPNSATAANYGKLPLSLEPNQGQTDAQVRFVSRGNGYTIFLCPASATFALRRNANAVSTAESAVVRMDLLGADLKTAMQPLDRLPGITNYLMGSTRRKWPTNLATYAKARAHNVYPGIDLIYYGTQGRLEYDFVVAPGAGLSQIRMKFAGATPVVDASGDLVLPLAGKGGQSDIRFHRPVLYQLTNRVRQPVSGGFIIAAKSHEVSFQAGSYDHGRQLVIDPVLVYSSYLGGSNISQINAMTVNAAGDIYVTGATEAINYPTTTGVIEPACPLGNTQLGAPAGVPKCGEGESGTPAAFVSKISADGQTLLYATYLGGGGNGAASDFGTAIAVDANDNAWVVGLTTSNDFPITANAYLSFCNPVAQGFNFGTSSNYGEISGCIGNATRSAFLVQLNPTGTVELYGTFLGGSGDSATAQIALDAAGNIYVAGSVYSNAVGTPAVVFASGGAFNYPTTASAYQPIALGGGFYSAFVTELAPGGRSLLYSTMFGGPYQHTINNALAVNAGKIFIGGYTRDPSLPTTAGALSKTCPSAGSTASGPKTICDSGAYQGFAAEFDPTKSGPASLVFSTYLNGSSLTQGNETSQVNALAADAAGNVYAGGYDTYTLPEGFPATPGALQPACLVGNNSGECGTGFVTKLSPSGALMWSTFYGSPSSTGGSGVAAIALDSSNNVYIAGNNGGLGDYPLNNGFQSFAGGGAYIAELSANGSQVMFGSYYGGDAATYPAGLLVDASGNIYLAGYTNADLPLVNALQSANYGGGFPEGFFAKIGTPVAAVTVVANAEGESLTIAPNTWVEIKGSNLAPDTRIWTASDFVNNKMPTQLDGAGVTMNGESTYVYYISPTQLNVLTPPDLAAGSVQVKVTSNGVAVTAFTAQAQTASPSFFVFNGGPYVAAVHTNGGFIGPATLFPGYTTPAMPGETLELFANGFGAANVPVASGLDAQSGTLSPLPAITIGGVAATVQFAGLVAVGEYQFNVVVPSNLANGDQSITATYNGRATQAGTLITIHN
jgi:uncharacterized protein (TIGR03437 family)